MFPILTTLNLLLPYPIFSPAFSSKIYSSHFIFRSIIHIELILNLGMRLRVRLLHFIDRFLIVPIPFIGKNNNISLMMHLLQDSIKWQVVVGLLLNSRFCFVFSTSILCQSHSILITLRL